MDLIRGSPYRPAASENAAFKGLTEDRTRSHAQKVKNPLASRAATTEAITGAELGLRFEQSRITTTAVAFWLDLESELVFVGDAGTTEPNDATRRFGGEFSLFWRPTDRLTLDAALALTDARFKGLDDDRIPGSVENVMSAGAAFDFGQGLTITARLRHFGVAPLIEDNSVRSDPTTLVNLGGYWVRGAFRLGLEALNVFDARDPDISYFYASRLPDEPAEGIEDRHIHPVEPRQVRASVRLNF